jgi:outer membrane lipoprotein-sorting protein
VFEVILMKLSTRWLPAVIAPIVVVAGAIAIPSVANAAGTPAAKTPQQVLALMADSKDAHYSGMVQQTSDLGLPQLPTSGAGGSSSTSSDASNILDLLTASHTVRVFADGQSKQRVQILDSLAERDIVHNGTDVWTYDSKKNAATHVTLPAKSGSSDQSSATTPSALADEFVQKIDSSTKLAVSTGSVAGRSTYQLTLTPKTSETLVGKVVLSVDSSTGLPLKVVVDARAQKSDAVSVAFTSIDYSTPAASTFTFTPPKGAKVTTKKVTPPTSTPSPAPSAGTNSGPHPSVTGTGWSQVVELPAGSADLSKATGDQSKLLNELTTSVSGGRALQTSLVSVLLTDDGRVLAGAVPVKTLEAAAQ